jgi:glycosyltransferase involved in cell wall biosynthesis
MKILFVIRDMFVGGAGKQLALTANALESFGHEIIVYSYCGNELNQPLNSSIKFITPNLCAKNKITEYYNAIIGIRSKLKQEKPDILISWRCNAGCFSKIASLGLGIKTVFSERTDPYKETSLFLKIASKIAAYSDGGIFQTEAVRQYYKRLKKSSVVIPNPIDYQNETLPFIPYVTRKNEIVHVARMQISQKRQDVMLEAFKFFLEHHPDYILSFYGDGVDFINVQNMAQDLGIAKSVKFHGVVSNAIEKISGAKLLVLTSDYEGIPNVILEAFAASVPVVSTDCSPGGARVLIDDGVSGFIAPVGDAEMIARKMGKIVDDEKLAEKFLTNGKTKLKEFAAEVIFEKWDEYLRKI